MRTASVLLALSLFGGCSFEPQEPTECEPVCELVEQETCDPALDCSSTQTICVDVPVELTDIVCHEETVCDLSDTCVTEVHNGSVDVTFDQTTCETSVVAYEDEVCDTETHERETRRVMDFDTDGAGNAILAGQFLEDAYADWGVTITVNEYRSATPGLDVISFDSSSPTGGDDDLGTQADNWGGPGYGSWGYETNFFERHNLLIHAEDIVDSDGDGYVDDPDDEAHGADFVFTFSEDVCVNQLVMIDIESNETGDIEFFDASGAMVDSQHIPGLGGNSVQVLDPEVCGVRELIVSMCGSGAVDDVTFTVTTEEEDEDCLTCDWTCDETSCEVSTETATGTYQVMDEDCWTEGSERTETVCEKVTLTGTTEFCYEEPVCKLTEECTTTEEEVCSTDHCDDGEWLQGGGTVQ